MGLILFLERKSIKKNFNIALYRSAIPGFLHGDDIALYELREKRGVLIC
ncbi:MAG: hypothetical protein HDT15_09685 [Oscillibacter sp.]|nr:hypothetical protein [Oscillibacter sp.]